MSQEEIIVKIHPDGRVEIDAVGFSGKGCVEATKFLEEGLGRASSSRKKPEYNEQTKNRLKQGR